jgi:hypothetical protein
MYKRQATSSRMRGPRALYAIAVSCPDSPLQPANVILQPSARMLVGIIYGKRQIGVALVRRRGALDIDLAALRQDR